jgi:CspA family cold shock protein
MCGTLAFMSTEGTVRVWHAEDGWGVVDSPETPGGCWVHFSQVAVDGYRALTVGQAVVLEWESPGQDGYPYRALRAWPSGEEPAPPPPLQPPGPGFASTLTLFFDEPDAREHPPTSPI